MSMTALRLADALQLLDERNRERLAQHKYSAYHAQRFRFVLDILDRLVVAAESRILDIGRSPLSFMLAAKCGHVTTLGFPLSQLERDFPDLCVGLPHAEPAAHIEFDLNDFGKGKFIDPTWGEFDVIVFAEVVEHLVIPPEIALAGLAEMLRPGGFIVCQTPNAAALHKRLYLLFGYNPYERLRVDLSNPGHFREYTKKELIACGKTVGLRIVDHQYCEYLSVEGGPARRAMGYVLKLCSLAFSPFSRSQTIIYQRP